MNMKMKTKRKRIPSKKIVSIPSKFETILKNKDDNKCGFGSSSKRFDNTDDIVLVTNSNAFSNDNNINNNGQNHFKFKSFEPKSSSYSTKGYGNGFVSRTQRFNIHSTNYLCSQCHEKSSDSITINSTFNDKHSRSTSFSTSKNSSHNAYFESFIKQTSSTPGPGTYSSRSVDDFYNNYNHYQSSFSSKSKRYFDSIITNSKNNNADDPKIISSPIQQRNNEMLKDNQNKKAPFNTSEKRFENNLYNNKNHTYSKYIDDILYKQSQFENSRRILPFDSRKRIISRIAKEKSNITDNYYYHNQKLPNNNAVSRVVYKTPLNSGRIHRPISKHATVPDLKL